MTVKPDFPRFFPFIISSCARFQDASLKGVRRMNLVKGLIAGVLGVGMLIGAGAANAAPTLNVAKPDVSSNVEQVRDHRGHHSRKHWKKRHHYKRNNWRSHHRHYRGPRWHSHRHYRHNAWRNHHRHHYYSGPRVRQGHY